MKNGFSLKKLIIGVIVALIGIGIYVNKISLVTINGNPELSATLTTVGSIAIIVIGVIIAVTAFISKRDK